MKVSPVAQATGPQERADEQIGRSVSPDRVERAKAAMEGREASIVDNTSQNTSTNQTNNIKSIKMKTNHSVYRDLPPIEGQAEPVTEAKLNIDDNTKEAQPATEETKSIDPQVALKAQINRAVQRIAQEKDAKIKELEAKLNGISSPNEDYVSIGDLKNNPLGILVKNGVTYDQLTEAILNNQTENNPAYTKLSDELNGLKKTIEEQNKAQSDRDEAAKKQVLNQMYKDASEIVSADEKYELVRETGSVKDAIQLIEAVFNKEGYVMDTEKALQLVEDELINDALKIANTKKVKSKLAPGTSQAETKQNNNNVRTMRTLTNRDGAKPRTSARERAIAAFYGRK